MFFCTHEIKVSADSVLQIDDIMIKKNMLTIVAFAK